MNSRKPADYSDRFPELNKLVATQSPQMSDRSGGQWQSGKRCGCCSL